MWVAEVPFLCRSESPLTLFVRITPRPRGLGPALALLHGEESSHKEVTQNMRQSIPERDWKYLKRVQGEMLSTLCGRINRKAMEILHAGGLSEHDKYKKLYRHIHDADKVVGDCFNDWRRSTLFFHILHLQRHELLTQEHLEHLTEATQASLKMLGRMSLA
jgi:hypothetical protein